MLGIVLPKKVLQNSVVNKRSDYVVGTPLKLIILQNVQLDIQVTQNQKGQWQTHPNKNLNG